MSAVSPPLCETPTVHVILARKGKLAGTEFQLLLQRRSVSANADPGTWSFPGEALIGSEFSAINENRNEQAKVARLFQVAERGAQEELGKKPAGLNVQRSLALFSATSKLFVNGQQPCFLYLLDETLDSEFMRSHPRAMPTRRSQLDEQQNGEYPNMRWGYAWVDGQEVYRDLESGTKTFARWARDLLLGVGEAVLINHLSSMARDRASVAAQQAAAQQARVAMPPSGTESFGYSGGGGASASDMMVQYPMMNGGVGVYDPQGGGMYMDQMHYMQQGYAPPPPPHPHHPHHPQNTYFFPQAMPQPMPTHYMEYGHPRQPAPGPLHASSRVGSAGTGAMASRLRFPIVVMSLDVRTTGTRLHRDRIVSVGAAFLQLVAGQEPQILCQRQFDFLPSPPSPTGPTSSDATREDLDVGVAEPPAAGPAPAPASSPAATSNGPASGARPEAEAIRDFHTWFTANSANKSDLMLLCENPALEIGMLELAAGRAVPDFISFLTVPPGTAPASRQGGGRRGGGNGGGQRREVVDLRSFTFGLLRTDSKSGGGSGANLGAASRWASGLLEFLEANSTSHAPPSPGVAGPGGGAREILARLPYPFRPGSGGGAREGGPAPGPGGSVPLSGGSGTGVGEALSLEDAANKGWMFLQVLSAAAAQANAAAANAVASAAAMANMYQPYPSMMGATGGGGGMMQFMPPPAAYMMWPPHWQTPPAQMPHHPGVVPSPTSGGPSVGSGGPHHHHHQGQRVGMGPSGGGSPGASQHGGRQGTKASPGSGPQASRHGGPSALPSVAAVGGPAVVHNPALAAVVAHPRVLGRPEEVTAGGLEDVGGETAPEGEVGAPGLNATSTGEVTMPTATEGEATSVAAPPASVDFVAPILEGDAKAGAGAPARAVVVVAAAPTMGGSVSAAARSAPMVPVGGGASAAATTTAGPPPTARPTPPAVVDAPQAPLSPPLAPPPAVAVTAPPSAPPSSAAPTTLEKRDWRSVVTSGGVTGAGAGKAPAPSMGPRQSAPAAPPGGATPRVSAGAAQHSATTGPAALASDGQASAPAPAGDGGGSPLASAQAAVAGGEGGATIGTAGGGQAGERQDPRGGGRGRGYRGGGGYREGGARGGRFSGSGGYGGSDSSAPGGGGSGEGRGGGPRGDFVPHYPRGEGRGRGAGGGGGGGGGGGENPRRSVDGHRGGSRGRGRGSGAGGGPPGGSAGASASP